ncbi:TRAP transporter substrate-binding protein [Enterovirga rhinocerotis]|uniref:TRAP-type mannitol/chloroaromatic compound transport system substrate-binding protein n=1 Tax=Enterovirga rhinocerotis TaxID=1339210 RepID=A0A4R7BP69_9HYPH|nr:TRAP transporter substrate-binding protein [Enterovirga rhinocerotis]TDR87318.1 TRAP-type mannitol/chloroaromatic compound transport system substrate-binding protein [Enterovirga rhinocerotis]
MERRHVLKAGALGLAASAVAAPAIAQSSPEIRWRLSSTFPKSLDTLYGASETFARIVSETTDGKFQIQPFAAGEIVGMPQALDAVSNGTVEMIHGPGYYYVGKDPTLALMADVPFMMNVRQRLAWMHVGGGQDLINDYVAKFNVYTIPGGNTGTQMGGWFRKEIKTLQDLQGLKFRIAGLAGQVLAKLGAVPTQIPGGDIYPALERGTIDAAEWVGPYDDEKLGFAKVAPFYYYPGFWEGAPNVHFWIGKEKWEALPKSYKEIAKVAASHAGMELTAKYDARNPAALRRLVAAGAQLRPFSQEILDAAFKASNEIYDDLSAKNPDFKKMYDSLRSFRNEEYLWFQVAEYTFDNYMIRSRVATSGR